MFSRPLKHISQHQAISWNWKYSVVQIIEVKAEAGFDPVRVFCLSDASGQRAECCSPLICIFSNTPCSPPTPLALGQCPPASVERQTQTTRASPCQAARLFVNNWLHYFTPHHTHRQQTEGRHMQPGTAQCYVCWYIYVQIDQQAYTIPYWSRLV